MIINFNAVQFSYDGALLIAHSNNANDFFVTMDVITGKVLSARSYSQ